MVLATLLAALLVPLSVEMPVAPIDAALSVLVFPAIVWLGASAQIGRRFERVATWSGEVSYPLYAIHYPIVLVATPVMLSAAAPFAAAAILVEAACVAGFALSVSRFYDAPPEPRAMCSRFRRAALGSAAREGCRLNRVDHFVEGGSMPAQIGSGADVRRIRRDRKDQRTAEFRPAGESWRGT
jgi:peptidoglycan/LPS O-acetylase OafA/YrhL